MLEVVGADVQVAVVQAALDVVRVDLDADRDAAVQGHGERLCATHPTQAGRERDGAGEGIVKTLACDGRERLVRALQDALGSDVDPRPRGHLAVHRQSERLQAPELVPRRPLRHEHRVGDEHARRPFVRVENSDRLARLHEQRLVGLETFQLANDGVERLPRARGAAGAAVHD